MAVLFEVTIPTINEHLSNLYSQGEIVKGSTIRNFRTVQKEGGREVARNVDYYNLDAIIALGFRVNSAPAIQFRQWATGVLRDYAIRGYVLDKKQKSEGIEALIYPSKDWFDQKAGSSGANIEDGDVEDRIRHVVDEVNASMLPYQRIGKITILEEPLEMTTTKKVKRFAVKS